MKVRKGVIGIIMFDGEFLVLKREHMWKGWEFVKGGLIYMEENGIPVFEDEELAVKREIKEETGLDVEILHQIPMRVEYEHPEYYKKKVGIDRSSHAVFLVKAKNKDVELSFEHSDFRWLPYEEARELLTYEEQKKALDNAMKFLKE